MTDRIATIIDLAAVRARRAAAKRSTSAPCWLAAEADRVLLHFADGAQLDLSPEHARVWAQRLAEVADAAELLARGGGL